MKLAGNDMLIQSLINEGVEFIFGYPGGAALHICLLYTSDAADE